MCRETNNSIDLDLPCKDHACVISKNIVYQLSIQDDMFNYIYTADFRQVVVYSNKGRVYHTECDTISSFDLIQPQNCSKYFKYEISIIQLQTRANNWFSNTPNDNTFINNPRVVSSISRNRGIRELR